MRAFADDTIIYRQISTHSDSEALQEDLKTLENWSRVWQMEFHPSKCQTLHITRSRKPQQFQYTLYNESLEQVDTAKYLGVYITADLRWNTHVQATRNNASATLGFLKRNLRISSTMIKTRAYQSYVRPKLEYASCVGDTQANISHIEMVQRQSAHWVLGRYHNTSRVTDMLSHLGWRSQEMRRADARLCMLYKMSNGLVALDTSPQLVKMSGLSANVHPHRFVRPPTANALQENSFFPCTIRQWNALHTEVALAPSFDIFKQRVCQVQHRA